MDVQTKVSGAETKIAKAPTANEPVIIVDSRLKTLTSESKGTLTLDNDKKLVHKSGTYYEGTVARVKTGRDLEFIKVDTNNREECDTLARAYLVNRICRTFGYVELQGVRLPKIDFAVNGTVKRFSVPAREEGQDEETYMKANKATLEELRDVLTMYLLKSENNQAAIMSFLKGMQ